MADETHILEPDATMSIEKASLPIDVDMTATPPPPNLSVPQLYRRKGIVQAVVYTGLNREELIRSAGAYIVNEDDAFAVSVDGHPIKLFPGDVCILRRDPTNEDEKTEGVMGPERWSQEFELA